MSDTPVKTRSYYKQTQIDQTIRLREVLKTLHPFAKDYFRAIEPRSSAKTRINYAYDIRVFFRYLISVFSKGRNGGSKSGKGRKYTWNRKNRKIN